MAQNNATLTKEQHGVMTKNKLTPLTWVVVNDLKYSMIVKHRITGEFRVIDK